ncbi:glycerophosphodiester phosphodiesterase [Marinactinospora thermotolerans]|uniref:glycerophosphodiester phosphodiesterase n=1 Tax=Marinactinospora thermotolerans DSM 45154 TaxID=1122192 RepID=A0A1T4QDP4_9ACTN|nr:glycerophosphodiester phosphodiesterase [Marinactinospora thermotolerans]SKA01794.1 glycerophosphoryl diester phosphodiesterase [Marinactinospora thermotolerans DSM 45154]
MRRNAPARAWTGALTTLFLLGAGLTTVAAPAAADTAGGEESLVETPWVIGHRGASAYRPEHTLAAYELAVRQGADFFEPDLVATKDGHLVSRHENELGGTTDVADHPEFADRRTTKVIDGVSVTGWFAEDFTLAELKTLRAVERIPDIRPGSSRYDGRYEIPTFEEILDLREELSRRHGRQIPIIPELKHGAYFDSIGLDLEEKVTDALAERGLTDEDDPVVLQSFEPDSARELDRRTDVRIVQLISGGQRELTTPEGLDEVAGYADAIGPTISLVLPTGPDGRAGEPTSLVADAHDRGLLVTPYTLRSENAHLPDGYDKGSRPDKYGDHRAYYTAVLETGVDGVFSDNPDHLYKARQKFLRDRR